MAPGENIAIAFGAIRANALRSLLTTLGIVIGVAAVIAVVSIVQGLQHLVTKELQGVGATYVMVMPDAGRSGPGVVSRQVRLTWEDGQAIRDQVPGIVAMTPVLVGSQQLVHRDQQHRALVIGASESWPEVNNHTVDRGRFFGRIDVARRGLVAVVGEKVVEELGLGENPLGAEITIGSLPFVVVGVMEKRGQTLGQDSDDLVFVPFETGLSLFGRSAGDQIQLRLQAESAEVVERVRDDIKSLLRKRHNLGADDKDDFQILLQDQILDTFTSILGSVTVVVGGVVGIALIVGGIGIMNIMLVSVTERTREIGLRKAIGARRRDILVQFLVEAVALSLVGGVLGVAAGWGLGALVSAVLPGDWPAAYVPLWAVALAFGFCSLVGIGFGIYPAGKAARLDPIEALRYE